MNSQDTQLIGVLARADSTASSLSGLLAGLLSRFEARGYALYLVGGSVRDAMLGRLGHDLDFTTPALPETVKEILEDWAEKVWDTGIEYGTVSAAYRGQQIEITTFRADSYDGDSRNPDVVYGDSLEGDLIRRDFKVNAMAIELRAGGGSRFHDPMGGLEDLGARIIDTPAAPEASFHDDPLRMLRAARFVSQLEFRVAERVLAAMRAMAGEIQRITVERVHAELDKLICGSAPWDGIDVLVETGIADYVFPEISALHMTPDEHAQHKDVYAHSLKVLRQAVEQEEDGPDLVLRWAALLHDVGKPATRETSSGKVTFHHHEVVGAKLVRRRLKKLKYPKATIEEIGQLVYLHMRFHGFGENQWSDSAVRRYVTDAGELLPRLHKLVRADCTTRNERKARRLQRTYDQLVHRIEELEQQEDLARVRPDLDGNEIMEILGLQPGPEVGKAWAFLKEQRLEHGPLEKEDAIAKLRQWWDSK